MHGPGRQLAAADVVESILSPGLPNLRWSRLWPNRNGQKGRERRRDRAKCLHRQTFQRLIPGDFGPAADQAVDAEVMVAGGWLAGAIYDQSRACPEQGLRPDFG
jgi:hypothetical protein